MPLRALLQLVLVPLATAGIGLLVIVCCPFDATQRLFPRLARIWCRVLCFASGVRVEVEGAERVDRDRATVFVSNHASHFDPPALVLALPVNFRVIAKQALFYIPVFGQALWAAGIIPIRRSNRERAIESMQHAADRIRQGMSVVVFAEGTRSRDGELQPLKKGAFVMAIQANVPVQPVVVRGSRTVLPRGKLFARPGKITVTFLQPVETDGLNFDHRDALRDEVAGRMQQALQPHRARQAAARTAH